MSLEVDYLPIAAAGGANVDSQVDFAGSGYQTDGFTSGEAISKQLNKCWRQSSMMAAAWANVISQTLNQNVLDDGNLSALITQILDTIADLASTVGAPKVVIVTPSTTPVFDCTVANPLISVFSLAMSAGSVTSSTFNGVQAGQKVILMIDNTTGFNQNFVSPLGFPLGTVTIPAGKTYTMEAVYTGSLWIPTTGVIITP